MKLLEKLKLKSFAAILVLSLCSTLTYAGDKVQSTTARNEAIVVKFFNKIFKRINGTTRNRKGCFFHCFV